MAGKGVCWESAGRCGVVGGVHGVTRPALVGGDRLRAVSICTGDFLDGRRGRLVRGGGSVGQGDRKEGSLFVGFGAFGH